MKGEPIRVARPADALLPILLLVALAVPTQLRADSGGCAGDQVPIGGVGSVEGGEATYTLKVEAPKSESGLVPTVDVIYRSRTGNALAGTGWSLAFGGSSIFRCPSTFDQDGHSISVRYADTDRLCLDGKRLNLVEGDYGKDAATYVTEIFDGRTIIQVGDREHPDAYFIVQSANGSVSLHRRASQAQGAPAPLYWYRTAWLDKDGNTIDYSYRVTRAGDLVPQRIRYSGTFDGERRSVGRHFIHFDYAERPDVLTSFLGGGESRNDVRLAGITTGTTQDDGTDLPFSTYQFHYRRSLFNGDSLLERVTGGFYDENGAYRCRYPTTLEWIDSAPAYAAPLAIGGMSETAALSSPWTAGGARPALSRLLRTGDLDADGRVELLVDRPGESTTVLRLDMDMRVVGRTPLPADFQPLSQTFDGYSVDTRNLGAADLVGIRAGEIVSAGWWEGGLNRSHSAGIQPNGDVLLVDIDGDGIVDVVHGVHSGDRYRMELHRGLPPSPASWRFAPPVLLHEVPATGTVSLKAPGFVRGGEVSVLLYMEGRLSHIVETTTAPGGRLRTELRTPTEYGISQAALDSGFLFADINGDGMLDIVFTDDDIWHVQVNADLHFLPAQSTGVRDVRTPAARAATLVADLDRDRRIELVFPVRTLVEFCIEQDTGEPLCGPAIGEVDPSMDFGLYHYGSVGFRTDAAGRHHAELREIPGLVGQANRSFFADLDGDGLEDLIAPYDAGISNGRFRHADGNRSACPPDFGCGARVALPASVDHENRRNGNMPALGRIRNTERVEHSWAYYPLSNPVRNLYIAPALESPDRYIDERHFHFRSSMHVVGEYVRIGSNSRSETRYSYGAAAYNSRGRGMQGFKWITVHHPEARQRTVYWFRQFFPFTSELARFWLERDRNNSLDFFDGKAGRHPILSGAHAWHCNGPAAHPLTREAGCKAHEHPFFETWRGKEGRRR